MRLFSLTLYKYIGIEVVYYLIIFYQHAMQSYILHIHNQFLILLNIKSKQKPYYITAQEVLKENNYIPDNIYSHSECPTPPWHLQKPQIKTQLHDVIIVWFLFRFYVFAIKTKLYIILEGNFCRVVIIKTTNIKERLCY
jgi:hypothetical protein